MTNSRPRILDLFCCQGGASAGYQRAGFDVYGVDLNPQPRYPFPFHRGDALAVLRTLLAGGGIWFTHPDGTAELLFLHDFAAAHASCPCQAYTACQRLRGNDHPDLVAPTRELLQATGLPWIIENVEGAPLIDPVLLCGRSFPELAVYRHRLFESNVPLEVPEHLPHDRPLRKMGRPPLPGEFMHVVGNFSGVEQARQAMGGVSWMNRDGLRESIPPAYTEHVGRQLHLALEERAA